MPKLEHVMVAENAGYHHKEASELLAHAANSPISRHVGSPDVDEIPPEGVLSLRRVTLARDQHEFKDIDETAALPAADGDRSLDVSPDGSPIFSDSDTPTPDVSFDVISPEKMQNSVSVDLLAGRPDREKAVPLRRSFSTRAPTLPRMRDVRRSWHGLNTNMRETLRNNTQSIQQGFRTSSLSLRER